MCLHNTDVQIKKASSLLVQAPPSSNNVYHIYIFGNITKIIQIYSTNIVHILDRESDEFAFLPE